MSLDNLIFTIHVPTQSVEIIQYRRTGGHPIGRQTEYGDTKPQDFGDHSNGTLAFAGGLLDGHGGDIGTVLGAPPDTIQ